MLQEPAFEGCGARITIIVLCFEILIVQCMYCVLTALKSCHMVKGQQVCAHVHYTQGFEAVVAFQGSVVFQLCRLSIACICLDIVLMVVSKIIVTGFAKTRHVAKACEWRNARS